MLAKSVLFLDPPEFCIRVESLVTPRLRERPIVVAAPGAERATVLALSAEARSAGVTRGTAVLLAKKLCPDLVVLPPNPTLYARASRALHEVIARYAPIVEPHGYGHAFCDVTGTERLFGPPVDVAWKLSKAAWERIPLPLAIGVAGNKLVSEVAAEVGKALRRSGAGALNDTLVPVAPGEEARFLAPNHVDLLPDLEQKLRDRLDEYQLERIGQVAEIPVPDLCAVFGARGRSLHAATVGIDPRPVLPPAVKAEFRVEHTLTTDTNDRDELDRLLTTLADALGRRLRRRNLAARRLKLLITYSDWKEAARTVALPSLQLDADLRAVVRRAFAETVTRTVALRTVGLVVDQLVEAGMQLELFDSTTVRQSDSKTVGQDDATVRLSNCQTVIDRITTRWGASGIRRGAVVGSVQVA